MDETLSLTEASRRLYNELHTRKQDVLALEQLIAAVKPIDEAIELITSKEERLASLEQDYIVLGDKLSKLQETVVETESHLKIKRHELSQLEIQQKTLHTSIQTELEAIRLRYEKQYQDWLATEKNTINAEIANLQAERDQLKREAQEAAQTANTLNAQVFKAREELNDINAQLTALEARFTRGKS